MTDDMRAKAAAILASLPNPKLVPLLERWTPQYTGKSPWCEKPQTSKDLDVGH